MEETDPFRIHKKELAMTCIDIEKQNETLSRLRDELSRLNQKFDEQKKALGLREDEEVAVNEATVPPQIAEAMRAAREAAEKAGRNAAAALSSEGAAPAAAPRRSRRGAIAI